MKVFLYDGNCPFCTKTAKRIQEICLSKDIEFYSFREISSEKLLEMHPDLNQDVLTANVQLIYEGLRYPGFFAVRKLVSHLKIYRYFFWILYLPLVPILGMFIMNYLKTRTGHDSKG